MKEPKKIKSLSKKFNLTVQILNKDDHILKDKEIILVNHFGVLQNYFKYAKSTFIGKSMVKKFKDKGGQNPIEAAKLECKIYHGPYVYNFHEIYKILEESGISKKINDYEELSNNLIKDLENPHKQNNKKSNSINDLGEKTLIDTMHILNNFIYNDTN